MRVPSPSLLPAFLAAACATDGLDSSNVGTLPQGGNTGGETTELCSDAAQCQVAKTSDECERLLWEADGERSASIQITPLSNRLVSGDASLQDEFDTDDTIDSGAALPHFACARLLIDSSHDLPDGGEWVPDGGTLTTREGGALTVQVDFEEALVDHATAAELCIGVQDGQTPRWGTFPNGNTSCLTYINTSDGFTY